MVSEFKRKLYDEYGGFADKRIKNLSLDSRFIVDDRNENDWGATGQLYPNFCQVFLCCVDDISVRVEFRGNVPESNEVSEIINRLGGTEDASGITFTIRRGEHDELVGLSRAIKRIVGSKRNVDPGLLHACRRTAKSLERLYFTLNRLWRQESTLS